VSARLGIHDLSVATGQHVLDLGLLAERNGVDPDKYRIGLGQDELSVPAPDEDVVTMGAAAALPILRRHGSHGIRTVLFATESGVDQSKSAGMFVHSLLELPAQCRVVELKQACYSATAGLQFALGLVARNPEERVLLIASDVARYELDSPGEPTQGAGAVAMLIGAEPALLEVEPITGVNAADTDDFWRPNDRSTAVVDGHGSIDAYLDSLIGAWEDYRAHGGVPAEQIDRFCYHQPFTRMAVKAHRALAERTGMRGGDEAVAGSTAYNRRLGNSYTASVYLALAALLDSDDELAGRRIGFFSYGSGSVGEFFTGLVQPGYRDARRRAETLAALAARVPLEVDHYRALHAAAELRSDVDVDTEHVTTAPFRFAGVRGAARRYERTA
jgi:hydroxymethylglutaryl-CoA synthase